MKGKTKANAFLLKQTPFYILHMVIPLIGIIIFLAYLQASHHLPQSLTVNYFQLMALSYPLLAAWVSTIVFEPEIEAGGGYFMLSAISRVQVLINKLLFILGSGLIACLLVTVGYGELARVVHKGFQPSLTILLGSALIIWGSALFLYLFHIWLILRFGKNVNFALAVVEVLLSALMLTGLGETIWFAVPSAWGMRLLPVFAKKIYGQSHVNLILPLSVIIIIMIIATFLMLTFLCIWFTMWEGRSNEE